MAVNWKRALTAALLADHQLLGEHPSTEKLEGISGAQLLALILASPVTITEDEPMFRLVNTGAGGQTWEIRVNGPSGRLLVGTLANVPLKLNPNAVTDLLQVGLVASDRVTIGGDLEVTGSILPDFAFKDGFVLEPLEEHLVEARSGKHLPGVPPAKRQKLEDGSDGPRESLLVAQHLEGHLLEIEKLYLYVEELKATLAALADRVTELEGR